MLQKPLDVRGRSVPVQRCRARPPVPWPSHQAAAAVSRCQPWPVAAPPSGPTSVQHTQHIRSGLQLRARE